MVKFVYNSNKADIAAIVPIIVKTAQNNDEYAINILKEASKDLVNITVKVYKLLGFLSKVKIAIKGSILTKIPMMKEFYIRYLSDEISDFEIIDEYGSPAKGGYYLACKKSKF